jgi:GTP-binding protein LepA
VVDASQGIQAQTLSNLFLAMDAGLEIIPVLNKIDLPGAEPEKRAREIMELIGASREEILAVSAKEGTGVPELLEAIVARVPPPRGNAERRCGRWCSTTTTTAIAAPSRASGWWTARCAPGCRWRSGRTRRTSSPWTRWATCSSASGRARCSRRARSATSTPTSATCATAAWATRCSTPANPAKELLPGYRDVKSMVFAGLYPTDSDQYEGLRDALEKLRLNDASLNYEPETSTALGLRVPLRFLGLLHMEIVQERLEREFNLDLLTTVPTVEYHVYLTDGTEMMIENPTLLPDSTTIDRIEEPYVKTRIMAPAEYIGGIMKLGRSGAACTTDALSSTPRGWNSTSSSRWARSCSTSTTGSRASAAATPRSTTRWRAIARPTW